MLEISRPPKTKNSKKLRPELKFKSFHYIFFYKIPKKSKSMQRSTQLLKLAYLMPKLRRISPYSLSIRPLKPFVPRYHFSTTEEPAKENQGPKVFAEPPELNFQKDHIENMEFKTETKRLLEIVAKSLYQDKEVFIRELLSNAADALEKQRYMQMSGKDVLPGDPLQVSVIVSESKKQIIIQDTGIGIKF